MHTPSNDDPAKWPRLGQILHWVDKPGSAHHFTSRIEIG